MCETSVDMSGRDKAQNLYDEDFYGWTQQQAALLKAGQLDRADMANIIEEIETLGRAEKSALGSSYRLVILHLLKMVHQPTHRSPSGTATIVRERGNIEDVLLDNPGLRPKRGDALARAYSSARREAASETRLPLDTFPDVCPFSLEEVERHGVWPDGT